jgi:uncharacterized protein
MMPEPLGAATPRADAHVPEHVRPAARRPGPDVVRALAMAGVVVMNYHGYFIIEGGQRNGGWWYDLFDPWVGPLSTRFAATFVLTAGVGVTLMTRSTAGRPDRVRAMRWRLARRGLVLFAVGKVFDHMWNGTILPYYGAMFALAALIFTLRSRWILLIGAGAAVAGSGIHWWQYETGLDGGDTTWLSDPAELSPPGIVFDTFVNGTHPLLPWLAFFCTGIVLGRLLVTSWWRTAAIAAGLVLWFLSVILHTGATAGGRAAMLLSDDPFDRSLVYVASALGTALVAFATISWIADRFTDTTVIDALRRAGQMSLTIYLLHAVVFDLLVVWNPVISPAGLARSLTFAAIFWITATGLAIAYQRRFGRGPAERVYRAITG